MAIDKYGFPQMPGQPKYEHLERDISKLESLLGRRETDMAMRADSSPDEVDLDTRLKYYGLLRKEAQKSGHDVDQKTTDGFPSSDVRRRQLYGGPETQFGERFGLLQDPGLEYIPRRPKGKTADKRRAPRAKYLGSSSDGKTPKSRYEPTRQRDEGFLSAAQREQLKKELSEGITGGRAGDEKSRKWSMFGQAMDHQ